MIVLRGSKGIREKVAEEMGVQVRTVNDWIRDESKELFDIRVATVISTETTIPLANLVEVQDQEKVA